MLMGMLIAGPAWADAERDAATGWDRSALQVRELAEDGRWQEALLMGQALLASPDTQAQDLVGVAELTRSVAWLHRVLGRYRHAEQHARQALALLERAKPPMPAAVASCLNEVGLNLAYVGRYQEAETQLRRAVAIMDDTAQLPLSSYVNSLGFAVEAQGRFEEAQQLYQRALSIVEQTLGPYHPHAAIALTNLANLTRIQGRPDKAEALYERALAIRTKRMGQRASRPAVTVPEFAGRLDAASARTQRLVPEHAEDLVDAPTALLAMTALAGIKVQLEEDAFAYASVPRLSGQDPAASRILNGLGVLYLSQGRARKAEPYLRQALIRLEQAYGPDHPDVARVANNLGVLASATGDHAEADALYQRASAIFTKTLGERHSAVALVKRNRQDAASAPRSQPPAGSASQKRADALEAMAASMNRRARIYMELGEYSAAEELLQGSLAIFERHYRQDDPLVAPTLSQYIELLRNTGRTQQADQVQLRLNVIKPPDES